MLFLILRSSDDQAGVEELHGVDFFKSCTANGDLSQDKHRSSCRARLHLALSSLKGQPTEDNVSGDFSRVKISERFPISFILSFTQTRTYERQIRYSGTKLICMHGLYGNLVKISKTVSRNESLGRSIFYPHPTPLRMAGIRPLKFLSAPFDFSAAPLKENPKG